MNKRKVNQLAIINKGVCGIDVGSTFHQTAIGMEKKHLKQFGIYTKDHREMIAYLNEHNIKKVAMESTGSYWPSLFYALDKAGFEVILVDGKQSKMLRKKTDVVDARSLYQLHTLGLLNSCFLPDELTLRFRHLYRHRDSLVKEAARHSNRMQKVLRLMNIRLDVALNDVCGKSGQNIIQAIIAGKRQPQALAELVHSNVKKSKEEIADSLEGSWNEELLFLLEDHFSAWQNTQKRMAKTDEKIKALLEINLQFELPEGVLLKKKADQKTKSTLV